jgi:hypothetical protein
MKPQIERVLGDPPAGDEDLHQRQEADEYLASIQERVLEGD